MKRKNKVHVIGLIISTIIAGTLFTVPAFADGGVYLSENDVTVNTGETAYVAISVDNATGAYVVSSDGNASANGSGWLDNESAVIGIYGASEGSGTVTIRFDTLATYDEEELDGTTLTVHVNVVNPEGGAVEPEKGNEEPTTEEQTEVVTEAETQPETQPETEPETAAPVAADPLQISLNGAAFTVLNDLNGVTIPAGFSGADGVYNGTPVKVIKFQDYLTLYALRGADGAVVFKTLNAQNGQFEDPKVLVQNGVTYYLIDIAPTDKVPSGYILKELDINGVKVKGLVQENNGEADVYYIRAIADGSADYYSYDSKQKSLQKIPAIPTLEKNETVVLDAKETNESFFENTKFLKIALIGAGAVVVALIVVIIILAVRKKKKKSDDPDDFSDDDFDDFSDDEYEREFAKEDFHYGKNNAFPFGREEENPDYVEEPEIHEPSTDDQEIEDIFDEDTWDVK